MATTNEQLNTRLKTVEITLDKVNKTVDLIKDGIYGSLEDLNNIEAQGLKHYIYENTKFRIDSQRFTSYLLKTSIAAIIVSTIALVF